MKSSSFSKMFPKDYQPVPETDKTEGASQGSSKKVGDALRFMVADAQKRQENGKTEAPEKSSQSLGNTGDKATRNPQGETDRSTAVNTDKVDPSQSPETRSKSSLQDLTNHAYNLIMRFREQNPNPSLKDIEMYKFMTDKYNIGLKHLRKLGIPTDLKPIMPIKFLGGADTPDRMDLDGMNFGSTEEIRTSGVGSLPPSNHWNFIYEQYGLGAQDQGQQPGAQDQGWGARPVGERRRDARRANAEANAARWGIDPQGLNTRQITRRVQDARALRGGGQQDQGRDRQRYQGRDRRRRNERRANAEANAARWGIDPQGLSTQQITARVRRAEERRQGEPGQDERRANAEANAARWGIDPQGLSTQQISARVRSAMERNEQDEQE